MDSFALIVFGGLAFLLLFILAVAFTTRKRPVSYFLDRKSNERWAAQAVIEESDTPQMVDAANEYRRKRGKPELSIEDFRGLASEQQRVVIAQASKQQAAKRRPRRRRSPI